MAVPRRAAGRTGVCIQRVAHRSFIDPYHNDENSKKRTPGNND